ncbi:MORN repeat-containing protein [Dasania marina]|uniref:MORN repeat-containing protein n=1 Tax=Dasania marina TaxID=471499 RepID=UPI000363072F|nr:hypothetical protein [Dasania marina]
MKKIIFTMCLMASFAHGSDNPVDYCKVDYAENGSVKGTYRGQCVNNQPQGVGAVDYYNGDKLEGKFNKGRLVGAATLTAAVGDVYKGLIVNGKRQGEGSYQWARGSSYVGEWSEDMRHGQGVFTWNNGTRFEGEFRDNKRYTGKLYSNNGRIVKCRRGVCR